MLVPQVVSLCPFTAATLSFLDADLDTLSSRVVFVSGPWLTGNVFTLPLPLLLLLSGASFAKTLASYLLPSRYHLQNYHLEVCRIQGRNLDVALPLLQAFAPGLRKPAGTSHQKFSGVGTFWHFPCNMLASVG
ncbi:hypothetical protein DL96DRAFT_1567652 [Flagelloscypha sp. PMI_526]|nr:hypothetical protein DL96DRAFT_1567652 [Flagelloscypha sp. PMI_526]